MYLPKCGDPCSSKPTFATSAGCGAHEELDGSDDDVVVVVVDGDCVVLISSDVSETFRVVAGTAAVVDGSCVDVVGACVVEYVGA